MLNNSANKISAVILVGGFGTRVRHILGGTPKPLAGINGKPFLHWVIKNIRQQNVGDIYLLTHHGSEFFEEYVLNEIDNNNEIKCIREMMPAGTGGSVLNFLSLNFEISSPFLLINGDSLLLNLDLKSAIKKMKHEKADAILFGIDVDDASRYGTMKYNEKYELVAFQEKKVGKGLINTGVYLFDNKIFDSIAYKSKEISMEREVIPKLLLDGKKFLVVKETGPFIDIGTEGSLNQASQFIRDNF